jgi:transcriptional regulator of acetoin/glycerol metabolism
MLRRDAWVSFQDGKDPTGVSAQLLDSWRRSRWSGVDPVRTEVPVVDVDTDTPFVRAAAPVLLRTAETLGDATICLALADARGSLVWRWVSDRSFTRVLDAVRMSTGTNFEEELVGTNGIGTAMESRELASVIGPDHYCQAFHMWACVAAPVRDPITDKICGAVNVTCWASDANEFLRGMTRALADRVHQRLGELAHPRERALLDAFLHGRARTTAPVLAVDAQTMIADEVAASWGLEHSAIWAAVSAMRPGSHVVVVREGLRAQVWPIDPDSIAAGAAVALYPDSHRAATSRVPDAPTDHGLGPLEAAEADVIARVLAECEGNKSATAARLRISRTTLHQKLHRYRLAWAPEPDEGERC